MSDPIDDLLAQLQPDQPAQAAPSESPAPTHPAAPAQSIEHLLSSLDKTSLETSLETSLDNRPSLPKAQSSQPPRPSQPSANPHFDALIHPVPNPPRQPDLVGKSPKLFKAESVDRMLSDLKAICQAQDQAEVLRQQEAVRVEQERQATLKRQQQGMINRRAQDWLKALDPASGEAAWFEEFAAKYTSRLEAAIDYLGLRAN